MGWWGKNKLKKYTKNMKHKETLIEKINKYENWILYPSYIEQAYKGQRLLDKLLDDENNQKELKSIQRDLKIEELLK